MIRTYRCTIALWRHSNLTMSRLTRMSFCKAMQLTIKSWKECRKSKTNAGVSQGSVLPDQSRSIVLSLYIYLFQLSSCWYHFPWWGIICWLHMTLAWQMGTMYSMWVQKWMKHTLGKEMRLGTERMDEITRQSKHSILHSLWVAKCLHRIHLHDWHCQNMHYAPPTRSLLGTLRQKVPLSKNGHPGAWPRQTANFGQHNFHLLKR